MRYFIICVWFFCLIALAYVPWKWTFTNIAGSTQMYAGYSWIWNPPNPPLELGIGWITQFDFERWLVQAFIVLIIFIVSTIFFFRSFK